MLTTGKSSLILKLDVLKGNPGDKTLVSSKKKHQSLMRFRAGIEGCISWLKRSFNMSRILDRSLKTFHSIAQCAAVAYNLTLLARILLRQEPA